MTGYYAVVSKSAVDFSRGGQGEGRGGGRGDFQRYSVTFLTDKRLCCYLRRKTEQRTLTISCGNKDCGCCRAGCIRWLESSVKFMMRVKFMRTL